MNHIEIGTELIDSIARFRFFAMTFEAVLLQVWLDDVFKI